MLSPSLSIPAAAAHAASVRARDAELRAGELRASRRRGDRFDAAHSSSRVAENGRGSVRRGGGRRGGGAAPPPQYAAGPFSETNYLESAAGSLAAMDLGSGTTLVYVGNPNDTTPPADATGYTPLSYTGGLGTGGWALFIKNNAVSPSCPQVGIFYTFPGGATYFWNSTLGTLARTPGKPYRIVLVDDGANFRCSVNGSPVVVGARNAYTAGSASARASLGRFKGLSGYSDLRNLCGSFAILHRAVSDAEAIAESGRHGSWDIGLATDAQCTVDANATRDYNPAGASWVTRGSAPVTLVKAGTVPSTAVASTAYVSAGLPRPEDSGMWAAASGCGISYSRPTQQARWLVDTDAEEIVVRQVINEGSPYYTDNAVRIVGGATPTPVLNAAYVYPYITSGKFTLGSGGTPKVVEVIASVQSALNSALTYEGGFPYELLVPPGRYAHPRAATVPTRRLVVWGDSMVAQRSSNPEITGAFGLVRDDYPGQVTIDAALGRNLYDDLNTGLGQAGLVASLVAQLDGSVTNELWLMVGLEDHWLTRWPGGRATFTTALNAFLVALRAATAAPIYYQTRGVADGPYATNGLGETIAQWRTAQSDACAGVSSCTVVDGATMYAITDCAADSATTPNKVHLSTAGCAVYKAAIKTALGY